SVPAMLFEGYANTTPKVFQGNQVYRSWVAFNEVQDWLIGGTGPGEGNIVVGSRGGMAINGNDIRVVGNYLRATGDLDGWNQVKTFGVLGDGVIVEHNVIRDGNWLLDILGGVEIRYNLLGDSHDRPWLIFEQGDASRKVHHNVFMRNAPQFNVNGVWVLQSDTSTRRSEIYNNTFYGGGKCWSHTGPAVSVEPG